MIRVGDFRVGNEEREAIKEVLDSGRLTEWRKVKEFERVWADYIGTSYALATNSGTSALIVGLSSLKYSKISAMSVITTPVTYIATSNAIVQSGYTPTYVDIDKETFGITPENVKEHLENSENENQIILPVHLMGYPCKIKEIQKIAEKYGSYVVEDAAQAHGSIYKGNKVGSYGVLSIYSFYIAHNLQAAELGAVNTSDYQLMQKMHQLKANGRMCICDVCTRMEGKCPYFKKDFDPRFTHDLIGYNFKTTEFSAALALAQLKRADTIAAKRRANVKYLNDELDKFSDVLQLPVYDPNVSYLAYPIVIKKGIARAKLQQGLEDKGVETRPLFGCIPLHQPAYRHLKAEYEGKLPNAEWVGENGFYIGIHQYLTNDDLEHITKAFSEVLV